MPAVISIIDTPVGPLLARARDGQLIQLSFYDRTASADCSVDDGDIGDAHVLEAVEIQIREYFARRRTRFELPLNLKGPAFHRRVWAALCEIPYGQTVSYGQLAARIGTPGSARAVGTANGANPIAIVVPCHRVIGTDGKLVGYGGGLARKQALLDLENGNIRLGI
jgi:methylated-DNA-[protein]-cysteine S-methyltransferase